MASPSAAYQPHCPARGVLYQVVRDHFETFRAQAAGLRDGEGPPRFVEQEFRDILRCGCLAAGFARLRCTGCGVDRLERVCRYVMRPHLNVHVHLLAMDGVFAPHGPGVRFHAAPDLTTADVADVLATIEPRIRRVLERLGFGDGDQSARPTRT